MDTAEEIVQTAALISSLDQAYQLKSIPRKGWIQSGIPEEEAESIAAHTYGISLLIIYLRAELEKRQIDIDRCLSMATIHDLAEAIVGDMTPLDGVTEQEKHKAEAGAMRTILENIPESTYLSQIWLEFEAGLTPEAQVVKRLDKLDMLLQAFLYEKKYGLRLDSFWEEMDERFKDCESTTIYTYIRSHRIEIKEG